MRLQCAVFFCKSFGILVLNWGQIRNMTGPHASKHRASLCLVARKSSTSERSCGVSFSVFNSVCRCTAPATRCPQVHSSRCPGDWKAGGQDSTKGKRGVAALLRKVLFKLPEWFIRFKVLDVDMASLVETNESCTFCKTEESSHMKPY